MMCNGYTYGTTREVMIAVDDSGSMGLGGGAAVVPYVFAAIDKVDPRCPRWGALGYRSLEGAGAPPPGPPTWVQSWLVRPFRRGRARAKGMLGDFTYEEGYGENPGFLMLKAGELGDVPSDETVTLTQETSGEPRVAEIFGWGGRALHDGPPRRILLIVGDEGTGIGFPGSDINDTIIASLQAAEITVLAINTWPPVNFSLDAGGGMTAICEATGGEIIQDAMHRIFLQDAPLTDEFGNPVLDENGEQIYGWQPRPQEERDEFVDEIASMIRRHKWRDVGYPFIV